MDRIIFFMCTASVLIFSCYQEKEVHIEQRFTLDSPCGFIIENQHNHSVSFSLKINDVFPMTIKKMLDEIDKIARKSKVEDVEAAWFFVFKNAFHSPAYTEENWQHHPAILLNSIGYGLCDDKASVLAYLWREMGYKVRVKGLEGHVVSEVFHNGKWKMYDADRRVFFYNQQCEIASVKEIGDGEFLISNNSIFNTKNSYTNLNHGFYTSTQDNIDNTEWHIGSAKEINLSFTLPPFASLSFLKDTIYNYPIARVIIPRDLTGELYIPLAPSTPDHINPYEIVHITSSDTERIIEYYLNPLLFSKNDTYDIKIESADSLVVSTIEKTFFFSNVDLAFDLYLDTLTTHFDEYFANSEMDSVFDSLFLVKDFQLYCSISNIPFHRDSVIKVLKMIEKIQTELQVSDSLIANTIFNYHPKSTYILYTCTINRRDGWLINNFENFE